MTSLNFEVVQRFFEMSYFDVTQNQDISSNTENASHMLSWSHLISRLCLAYSKFTGLIGWIHSCLYWIPSGKTLQKLSKRICLPKFTLFFPFFLIYVGLNISKDGKPNKSVILMGIWLNISCSIYVHISVWKWKTINYVSAYITNIPNLYKSINTDQVSFQFWLKMGQIKFKLVHKHENFQHFLLASVKQTDNLSWIRRKMHSMEI